MYLVGDEKRRMESYAISMAISMLDLTTDCLEIEYKSWQSSVHLPGVAT